MSVVTRPVLGRSKLTFRAYDCLTVWPVSPIDALEAPHFNVDVGRWPVILLSWPSYGGPLGRGKPDALVSDRSHVDTETPHFMSYAGEACQ